MTRLAVLFALSCLLISCAKPSPPIEPIEQPRPVACDPRIRAPIEAEPPVAGSIVQPVTAAEVDATRAFLTGEAEARAWGRRGWERADVARGACPG